MSEFPIEVLEEWIDGLFRTQLVLLLDGRLVARWWSMVSSEWVYDEDGESLVDIPLFTEAK